MVGKRRRENNRGVTLIELMVALVMTAIIVSIIFAVWGNFGRHVIIQRRKSVLHAEIRVVLESITSQLRRSPAVLAWHSSGITYVSPNNGDTIVYEFYTDELLKNDAPVILISQDAYISNFSVGESEVSGEMKEVTLLSVAMTVMDEFYNQISLNSQIAVKILGEDEEGDDDELSGWNF